jgi:hypothetical protein
VPVPDHPDPEQLAAFQAGDGDRRQLAEIEAHLADCPSCAGVVTSVEQARARLTLLEEPDLPPGLHDRLAAALEAEAAQLPAPVSRFGRAGRPAAGQHLPGSRAAAGSPAARGATGSAGAGRRGPSVPGARPVPWYRRRVAWAAAAALLLAALVAVPLLDRPSDLDTAGGAGGGQAAQDLAAPETAGSVPVIRVPGEVTAASVRSRLASDHRAKAALDAASAGTGGAQAATRGSRDAAGATQPQQLNQPGAASATPPAATGPAGLRACLPAATAAADPATRPLTPAFYLEGTWRGRAATVLVTASSGRPGRVDLWVFPRGSCSGRPLATERVR